MMLEKFQAFAGGKFDMNADMEGTYTAKLGDAAEKVRLSPMLGII